MLCNRRKEVLAPLHDELRQAAGYEFRCCGWGSSRVSKSSPSYRHAFDFAVLLAREGIPIISGGPYTAGGEGRGIQHALLEGAHSVDPSMAIGCELVLPAWGTPSDVPCGYNYQSEDFGTRLRTMSILATSYVCFPEFGFGTDYERAFFSQMIWLIHRHSANNVPKSIFSGPLSLELGHVPKLVLIGSSYRYVTMMLEEMVHQGSVTTTMCDLERKLFLFAKDFRQAVECVRAERSRWVEILGDQGRAPDDV